MNHFVLQKTIVGLFRPLVTNLVANRFLLVLA
jgi:hypothetical protein